jgi:PAS domain S-box-containing protein
MMRASSEAEYLEAVCGVIVECCGYSMVWIGLAEEGEAKRIVPVAFAGFDEDYVKRLNVTWADTERGRGPAGTAIRTGKPTICDVLTDPDFMPWRQEALKRGYASVLSLPVINNDRAIGVITLYSQETNEFSEEEVTLLMRLSSDLAYGLTTLRLREERARAEETPKQREKMLKTFFDAVHEGMVLINTEGTVVLSNISSAQRLGTSVPEFVGTCLYDHFPPDVARCRKEQFDKVVATGEPAYFEDTREGRSFEHYCHPLFDEERKVSGVTIFTHEITLRKHAEAMLQESEQRYRRITEGLTDYLYTVRVQDGRAVETTHSEACVSVTGYRSEEFAAFPYLWLDMVVPEDRDHVIEYVKGILAGKQMSPIEHRIMRKDGQIRWVSDMPIVQVDSLGRLISYDGVIRDITERKHAETALQESEEKFRLLFEKSADAILLLDGDTFADCNEAALRLMGCSSKEQLTGLHPWDISPERQPDGRLSSEKGKELISETMRRGINQFEWMRRTFEGEEFWVEVSHTVIPIQGRLLMYTMWRDIRERKHAEAQLRESEERYRTAIESSNDGVALVRGDRHIYVNRKFLEIFGYRSLEEVVGKTHYLTVHPDDRQKVVSYNRRRQRGEAVPDRYEFKGLRKNGEIVYIEASATGTTYQGEAISLVFLRDVTERKSLEEQLLQAQKMEAIGTLAGGVAHDFNNILMALMGYANLLQMQMGQNDPSRVYVDQILASTAKAANITQSLLVFGRKQTMEMKPHKITTIVKDVEKLLQRLMPEDIELTIKLGDDATVRADMTQIDQVLINLATNARDAMPKGGRLTIETGRVVIDEEFRKIHGYGEPGKYALVSVADTGTGIDEKTKERMFEPFFTTKEVGKGTGLGLSIVYGIVKQHSGYITVESEQGKGTFFHIYLPEVRAEVAPETKEAQPDMQGGTETILLAEDNLDIRRVTSHTLAISGYTVIEAADGRDAVEKFREHQDEIKLIILDVVMPEKNGKEAYEEIRTMRHDIKALFMSGYTSDVVFDKGVLAKALDYIAKPIAPNELLHKVRNILDR